MASRREAIPYSFFALTLAAVVLVSPPARANQEDAKTPQEIVGDVIGALRSQAPVEIVKTTASDGWTWTELEYFDEVHPLVVDIVNSDLQRPSKVLYMLPGAGLNFHSDFFTPEGDNIAHFMRQHDYLIVGINPREDAVSPATTDFSFMADWGLAKRKQDIRGVIEPIEDRIGMRYDVLGHSAGALEALDYASTFSDVHKVMALDMVGTYDPVGEASFVTGSEKSYAAQVALLAHGAYANTSIAGFRQLIHLAGLFPNANSGVPRAPFGGPGGNFTLEGLMFWALIHTNTLPGPSTPYTGLPENWYYHQGFFAGTYTFNADPTQDVHALTQTDLGVVREAVNALGSGISPTAARRDTFASFSNNGAYSIAWENISEKVVWVAAELGLGDHPYAADLIRAGGNHEVKYLVVPGYGHADVTWATDAEHDVWPLFLR